jgi:cytochrome b561
MTIRRTSTLHDLIRGGDTWRHQLRMLFASLGLSLLVGLVIALAVAWTQYARATHPRARRSEPHQARWRAVAAWVGNVRCAAHGVVGAGKTLAIREQLDD